MHLQHAVLLLLATAVALAAAPVAVDGQHFVATNLLTRTASRRAAPQLPQAADASASASAASPSNSGGADPWSAVHARAMARFRRRGDADAPGQPPSANVTNIHYHITHVAGTALYHLARANELLPSAAERNVNNGQLRTLLQQHMSSKPKGRSPGAGEQSRTAVALRRLLESIPQQWTGIESPLSGTLAALLPWQHTERFVFTTAIRHPLWRTLAREAFTSRVFPEVYAQPPRLEAFLQANSSAYLRDNYQTRWLSGHPCMPNDPGCARSGPVTRHDLHKAMERLQRFSLVMVVDDDQPLWFNLTVSNMCRQLGLQVCAFSHTPHPRPAMRALVANDTLYADMLQSQRFDMQLFAFAKALAYNQLLRDAPPAPQQAATGSTASISEAAYGAFLSALAALGDEREPEVDPSTYRGPSGSI